MEKALHKAKVYYALTALIPAVVILLVGLLRNNGEFFFTLDDAYIHLSVARSILHGGYGLNIGEYGSPASSPLWPFLLVPGFLFNYPVTWVIIINLLCILLTAIVAGTLAEKLLPHSASGWVWVLVFLFIWLVNGFALPFMGMEHSLQVLLTVCAIYGVYVLFTSGNCRLLFAAACVAPLVRYENVPVAAVAIAALWFTGRRLQAGWLAVCIAVPLLLFSFFLHKLGLPLLPNSVLVKTGVAAAPIASVALLNPLGGFASRFGVFLLPAHLAVLAYCVFIASKARGSSRFIAVAVAAVITAHLLGGKYGGFGRYEVYVNAFVLPALFMLWAGNRQLFSRLSGYAAIVLASVASLPYGYAAIVTPAAAGDIRLQQEQMAAFTRMLKVPVAANDIGLLSFASGEYVLDMFGLNTGEFTPAKIAANPLHFEQALHKKNIPLLLVYSGWFPRLPWGLQRAGVLRLKEKPVFIGREVVFLAFPESVAVIRAAMHRYAPTLPRGAEFVYE